MASGKAPTVQIGFLLRASSLENDADASSGMVTAGLHAESVIECVQRSRQARAGAAESDAVHRGGRGLLPCTCGVPARNTVRRYEGQDSGGIELC